MTRLTALAAPVEVGTMLMAAARARRRSLCGPSCRFWSWVYAWIVVIRPRSMPNVSLSTFAIGARQLVVQDAFEMTVVLGGVVQVVVDAHHDRDVLVLGRRRDDDLLGAVVDVHLGLGGVGEEAGRLDDDVHAEVGPVRLAGSRSANTLIALPPTVISSAVALTSCGRRPRIESYLSRWASVVVSVRSFTPTTSMSAPEARTARKKLRPIRPKPLMPTRMVTGGSPRFGPPDSATGGGSACRPFRGPAKGRPAAAPEG